MMKAPPITKSLRSPNTTMMEAARSNFPSSPEPQQPGLLGRAQELLNHIESLEREHSILRGNLFCQGETGANKANPPSGLEGMIADACSRVACMVGDMATINGKVA